MPAAMEVQSPKMSSASPRALPRWTPWALALLFALWSLRGVGGGNIVDTDAARHAMNGVFIHDLVASGHARHPVGYAREYYGRLPALSMPYHPPLFPAMESLFFFAFGVNLLAARLAVAVAVAISVVLLYYLVRATQGSDVVALCVTVSMSSVWWCQQVASDVMLEYPALAFALAALWCVRDLNRGVYPLGRALLFAAFGAAAVWTKQFTVFVGAVPPLYAVVSGRWRLLFSKGMWISSALFGGAVIALTKLSATFNRAGIAQVPTTAEDVRWLVTHNFVYYLEVVRTDAVGVPAVFAAAVALAAVWIARRRAWHGLRLGFYWVWIAALAAVLLPVGAHSNRYLFFLYPALMAIGYALLQRAGKLWLGEARAWRVPAALAAAWIVAAPFFYPETLRGPAEAAAVVVNGAPERILYAGDADGNFIFAARTRDPQGRITVVPGQKLPDDVFAAPAFEDFCRRHGINWIVLEQGTEPQRWSALAGAPTPSMRLERTLPLSSSRTRWRTGKMYVYRFTAPSMRPDAIELPVTKIQDRIEVPPAVNR